MKIFDEEKLDKEEIWKNIGQEISLICNRNKYKYNKYAIEINQKNHSQKTLKRRKQIKLIRNIRRNTLI